MRTKAKIVAAALILIAVAILVNKEEAGEIPPQIITADWEQIVETTPINEVEAVQPVQQVEEIKQQYIPSTEAAEGYISEAELVAICEEAGEKYQICPELLQALVERESSGYIQAINGNCKGLAQISTRWHTERMERLGVTDIYEPRGNILVAADYLRELFDEREDDDVYYVLMRYNMAIDTANELYAAGEITDYAIGITERAAELERLHGK